MKSIYNKFIEFFINFCKSLNFSSQGLHLLLQSRCLLALLRLSQLRNLDISEYFPHYFLQLGRNFLSCDIDFVY